MNNGLDEVTQQEAASVFEGRTVAVVGNAESIFDYSHGPAIDEHDVVVRMNLGVPHPARRKYHQKRLGLRTDVLTAGKAKLLKVALRRCSPRHVWWMKLSRLGDKHLLSLRADERYTTPTFIYPQSLEDEAHEFVGSPPSSGIRVLHFLAFHAEPSRVSVFGVNWFGATGGTDVSWWKNDSFPSRGPAPAHKGAREAAAFLRLGYVEKEPGWHIHERPTRSPVP